jgi:hypothetical protein
LLAGRRQVLGRRWILSSCAKRLQDTPVRRQSHFLFMIEAGYPGIYLHYALEHID